MLKKIFLPLTGIILSTLLVIYFCYIKISYVAIVAISFVGLGLTSNQIFYFIFCSLFPDTRNLDSLPAADVLRSPKTYDKGRNKTIAFILTVIFTFIVWFGGTYIWTILTNKYINYHLTTYGKRTKGVVVYVSHNSKSFGTYSEYEYSDEKKETCSDIIVGETLNIGDTVSVFYSTDRPEINKVTF
jgi:hypothetical protein